MLHLPIPVPVGSGWFERGRTSRDVARVLEPIISGEGEGVDVHAHIGIMSGSAVHRWPRGGWRLFVYEHSSFVVQLLTEDDSARSLYGETVARAERVMCVNPRMAAALRDLYPAFGERIDTHPNAVEFARFGHVERKGPLRRWLYIGNLKPAKGTRRLLSAFEKAMKRWGDLSLTLVGAGADLEWLAHQGLGSHVRVLPPLAPRDVPRVMGEADLLVHLSEGETFGLTAIEAVASGLPVLLTSTDGSELVMRPVIDEAGAIVSTRPSDEEVLAAYSELRDVPERLNLTAARGALESRYGIVAVRDRLAQVLSQGRHAA